MAGPGGAAAGGRNTGKVLPCLVFQDLFLFEKEETPGSTSSKYTISTWVRAHPSLKFVQQNQDYIKTGFFHLM